MDSNTTPRKLLAQAERVARVWQENPQLQLNGASLELYLRVTKELREAMDQLLGLERRVRLKMIERDQRAERLNELTIRFRAAVCGYHGPDSIEYGQVGGTRTSKRRKPGPKPRSAKN